MVHASAVPYLEPLSGEPDQLEQAGTHYLSVADQIREVSRGLADLSNRTESFGRAADALHERTLDVSGAVEDVIPRYETTANAIKVYAVALADAQAEARTALTVVDDERNQLWSLYTRQDQAEQDVYLAAASGASDTSMDDAHHELRRAGALVRDHEEALDVALRRFRDAEDAKDAAALRAADAIRPVLDQLDDSFGDKVGAFFAPVGDFLAMVDQWLADVLEQVLQWLSDVVVIVLAIALVAFSFVVYSIPALLGWVTWDQVLDAGIGATMILLKGLAPILVPALWAEVASETPEMRFTGVTVESPSGDPYTQAFKDAEDVDLLGGADSTAVRIVRVGTGPDGLPVWRVIPPSTQDWELGSDTGAANDLGSNLTLMLAPDQQAAYERMVLQAMEKAGIGPQDHVMMVGFSQGGILAGKFAADPDLPYNIEAIVVAGAPIDAMDIPSGVSVVSYQHRGDPVHRLDGEAPPSPHDRWVTVETDTWDGPSAPSSSPFFDAGRHHAGKYSTTAEHLSDGSLHDGGYVSGSTQDAFEKIRADQSIFFGDSETYYTYEGSE
ncbi:hypothetical protein EQW78_10135 [Oerskovia turbata]|uniref:Alpha/beta hydrolase n=1 Tax=Oerskovia turbata TaxID=1713 RepID=A0A4Q1KUZ3_9CELL|nr:hypothetical protein [Oerskovia turbata]RXR25397.1 hypothetical protein EQW73_11180 [Oerskovia turbata]RXR33962.1 hypothetical protein EQW78_10135 [Oerskovia turbata]TGJ95663.1 hypothetical protein DLJ96_14190 [Actinotalea fermentans ATCC 43279 = JCM 9966 = DSM 3133]